MGYTKKAIESFVRMREFGVEPDAHMYNTILREMLNEKLLELALALYTTMLKSNVEPNFYTYNMLIDGLCKRGEVKGAQELLDEMKRVGIVPCVLSMTSILYSCWFPPSDMISCNVVLNGFCKTGRLKEALSFVWLIKKDGFSLNRNSYTSLINGFFKARRYREARVWYTKMFEEGIVPDVVLYAIMIRGLSEEGRVGEAGKMLEEMNQIGLTHDAYCYNVVIQGLCDVGLLNRAQSLHLEISERNVCTHTILICEMCK
ncbi:putative pentatricopeptide [Medicago truncatula]|uniref:Putative pentatricopeptide n=1 Tax=Medicago truncatula TaxID=3880 RepID=A0A396IVU3_MEDTR|nr:putative pentatricopeptide [Medicago truncatula]